MKKKGGTSLEGIKSGRFRLQNGRTAFVVLEGYKALCFETKNGDLALFGVEDFDGFLEKVKSQIPHIEILN